MSCSWTHRLVIAATMTVLSATASISSAQQLGSGEFVVRSQVVSDEVSAPGTSSGGSIMEGGVVSASAVGGGAVGGGVAQRRDFGQPDLFYNYYTQGGANSANAQMYVSPVPVPAVVGNTHLTYQPWYPHQYLYHHQDRYHNYYDNGRGMNRTRATYYSPPVRQAASNIYWNYLRIPR